MLCNHIKHSSHKTLRYGTAIHNSSFSKRFNTLEKINYGGVREYMTNNDEPFSPEHKAVERQREDYYCYREESSSQRQEEPSKHSERSK